MLRFLFGLSLLCLAACQTEQVPEQNFTFDYLILNGTVYDGSNTNPKIVAVGISGDRIVFVGDRNQITFSANRTIDASNHLVTPGFIDPHTHADGDLLDEDKKYNLNYVTQGVSTVFIGNDGTGSHQVQDLADNFTSRGIGTNVAQFVGHGDVRRTVMGNENRAPSDSELETMKQLVASAMEQGALGLSSGLWYVPGSFAETEEVVALTKEVAKYGGIYESHIRDESNYSIGVHAAIEEAIEIGRRAGTQVHIAHLKVLGVDVWHTSNRVVEIIEQARSEGLTVTADQYPWQASGTRLRNTIVPRRMLAGSNEDFHRRLQESLNDADLRSQMRENLRRRGGADAILIIDSYNRRYAGRTLAEIAEREGADPLDKAIQIMLGGTTGVASFNMHEEDIVKFMSQSWVMTSSDGSDGHPRKFGSFPRKFRKYVKERQLLSPSEFVHRSSGLVADTFRLPGRGYIREGNFADISIIDHSAYTEQADFENWNTHSRGVRYLWINGQLVLDENKPTRTLSGRVLRPAPPR